MSTATVTYTFTNGTTADGTQVSQNFTDILAYLNGSVILKDATVAFTAVPSGPSTDPSSGNQFTRKTYVDNLVALRSKANGTAAWLAASGTVSDPSTKTWLFQGETRSRTFAAGVNTITFPTAFPNGVLCVMVGEGGAGSTNGVNISVVSTTTTQVNLKAWDMTTDALYSGTATVAYYAVGF